MSNKHNLDKASIFEIQPNKTIIERVSMWKVLGLTIQQNLTWNDHITTTICEGYSALRTLRKIKRLTPFHVRKLLAETLILPKIDYGNVIFTNAPDYLLKRLQKLQNSAAGYVYKRYANENDVISLNWLPIKEKIQYNISVMAFNALNNPSWPEYLQLKMKNENSNLRSRGTCKIEKAPLLGRGTFHDNAEKIFNDLPTNIREEQCLNKFKSLTKTYFKDRALARTL